MKIFPLILCACSCSCSAARTQPPTSGVSPERVADMIHAVVEADRKVYASRVINRLVQEEQVRIVHPATGEPVPLAASEDWKASYGTLPLPAQVFRMGAEQVLEKQLGMSYALLSPWPINKLNRPRTDAEIEGLRNVTAAPSQPFYRNEELAGRRYLTAVYADVAVAPACASCHNAHPESPRSDFKVGDVMGGVVVRVPLD
jgi:hypothetical protein